MISIAVVSLNNPAYLDLMLRSLRRNTEQPFEVLVHLNKCQSEDQEIANKWRSRGIVKYISTSDENLFCGPPINKLFADYATGEYFIFLDDDLYMGPGWDTALLNAIPYNYHYWWLSPTLYYPKYAHQPKRFNVESFGMAPDSFRETDFNKRYLSARNITRDNLNWVSGAGLVSRVTWEKIGGYDTDFLIGEDVDIKAKVWQCAKEAGEIPFFCSVADSIAYHFGHAGSNKRPQAVDPFKMFRQKWGMTVKEFYKQAMPGMDYL